MEIIAASLAGALVIAAAVILALRRTGNQGDGRRNPARKGGGSAAKDRKGGLRSAGLPGGEAPRGIQPHCCPLCSSPLASGERVRSDLSTGPGDRIMRIFGCPTCWPSSEASPPRLCPVCGGEIPRDGYAVARYFERPGRKHVHVLGCSKCRPGA